MFAVLHCESGFPDSGVVFTLYPACLIYYHHPTQRLPLWNWKDIIYYYC